MLVDWIWDVVRFDGREAEEEAGRGVELEEEGPVGLVERIVVRSDPKVDGEVARRLRSKGKGKKEKKRRWDHVARRKQWNHQKRVFIAREKERERARRRRKKKRGQEKTASGVETLPYD